MLSLSKGVRSYSNRGSGFHYAVWPGSRKCMGKIVVNPFTLRAAKRGLTNFEIFYLQKHFLDII